MAKYDVECPDCGETYQVNLIGPQKDRMYKLDNWDWTCDDCRQKARDEENSKAASANADAGLPPLTGTEKQIAWAETIRASKLDTIQKALSGELDDIYFEAYWGSATWSDRAFSVDDPNIEYVISLLKMQTSGSWWIDNRDAKIGFILKELFVNEPPSINETQGAKTVEAEAKIEATVRPESPLTETIAEIRIKSDILEVYFPEKRKDFWEIIKKKLGYSWSGTCWQRKITIKTGSASDRATETGYRLLSAGFCVCIFDKQVRSRAISGEYEPECHRWVIKRTSGKYEGWFSISWPYGEDFYKAAKKLPGSHYCKPDVVVPAEQFEQILDFAEIYEFRLSPGAQELVETARKIKERALTAQVEEREETKQPLPGDKPEELEVPESVNINDEFKEVN